MPFLQLFLYEPGILSYFWALLNQAFVWEEL